MKIFVCVKHVPDTAANIKVDGETSYADKDIKFIANPYDEFGVEEAVTLVESQGGEVVIVTVGGPSAKDTIRGALAMGATRGIHVTTDAQFLDSETPTIYEVAAQHGVGSAVFYHMYARGAEVWQPPNVVDIARFTKGRGILGMEAGEYDEGMLKWLIRYLDAGHRPGVG